MERQDFDQSRYWVDRHKQFSGDPRSVGNMAATAEQNAAGERELQAAMDVIAKHLARPGAHVLDLGCGYGRIAKCFTGNGLMYLGLDVSPDAIVQATKNCPEGKFEEADLLTWQSTSSYDIVCALFVFVHFVNDPDWERFLESAMASVKTGGYLVIADHFPPSERQAAQHYVSRPFQEYLPKLGANGFVIDDTIFNAVSSKLQGNNHIRYFRFAKKV